MGLRDTGNWGYPERAGTSAYFVPTLKVVANGGHYGHTQGLGGSKGSAHRSDRKLIGARGSEASSGRTRAGVQVLHWVQWEGSGQGKEQVQSSLIKMLRRSGNNRVMEDGGFLGIGLEESRSDEIGSPPPWPPSFCHPLQRPSCFCGIQSPRSLASCYWPISPGARLDPGQHHLPRPSL